MIPQTMTIKDIEKNYNVNFDDVINLMKTKNLTLVDSLRTIGNYGDSKCKHYINYNNQKYSYRDFYEKYIFERSDCEVKNETHQINRLKKLIEFGADPETCITLMVSDLEYNGKNGSFMELCKWFGANYNKAMRTLISIKDYRKSISINIKFKNYT